MIPEISPSRWDFDDGSTERLIHGGAPANRPGSTNRGVAGRLFIGEVTVKTHLLHIYAELGVNDRAAAVGAAFERGLLTPGDGTRDIR